MLLGTKGAVVVLRHAPETIARRTSFEESLRFERVHEEIYRNFGFEFVPIIPGSLSDRVDAITCSAPLRPTTSDRNLLDLAVYDEQGFTDAPSPVRPRAACADGP